MKFFALDFEAAGVSDREKAPVTLGLALMDGSDVIEAREWVFAPILDWKGNLKYTYTQNAEIVHGYSLKRLAEQGLSCAQIYAEVRQFVDGHNYKPIVSHDAQYDSSLWSNFIFECGSYDRFRKVFLPAKELLCGPWFDSRRIAQRTMNVPLEVPDLKLNTLTSHFGIGSQSDIHGAKEDAILAGRLFAKLQPAAVA